MWLARFRMPPQWAKISVNVTFAQDSFLFRVVVECTHTTQLNMAQLPPLLPPSPDLRSRVASPTNCHTWHKLGACPYGERCLFAHDPKKAGNAPHCRTWLSKGKCDYGDKCWYKHDPNVRDSKQKPDCKSWRFYGHCSCGDACPFRHIDEMRGNLKVCYKWRHGDKCDNDGCPFYHETESEVKQVFVKHGEIDCKGWMHNGYCPNGDRCHYRHDEDKQGDVKVCYAWRQEGYCKHGLRCPYVHEQPKDCHDWMRMGECRFGDDCRFNHDDAKKLKWKPKEDEKKEKHQQNQKKQQQKEKQEQKQVTLTMRTQLVQANPTTSTILLLTLKDTASGTVFDHDDNDDIKTLTIRNILDAKTFRVQGSAAACRTLLARFDVHIRRLNQVTLL